MTRRRRAGDRAGSAGRARAALAAALPVAVLCVLSFPAPASASVASLRPLSAGAAGAGALAAAAVQEADTVSGDTAVADTVPGAGGRAVADSLLPDSLRSLPDSLLPDSLRGDSVRTTVSVEDRREALAGGGFPSRDSLYRALAEMPGYRVVEYRGRDVELQVPGRLIRLRDSAQANYSENALRADTILYRGGTRFVEARGRIELVSPEQEPVRSDSVLYYDVGRRKGTIYRAETRTSARGATWRVEGDAIPSGRRTLFVESGRFSSCTLDTPHYHFRAGDVKMVSQDVLVAWPIVLRIGRVPVAWLPFFAHSIRPERASGILPPRFGFNDVVRTAPGMQRQVSDFGYYWAINRHMDAQTTMSWFSGDHTEIQGRFRYNFIKDFIDGNLGVARSWGQGGTSLQFDWQHNQELSPNTTFRVSAQFLTNTRTFRDRSFDPRDQLRKIRSNVGFNHRLSWANLSLSASRDQAISGEGGVSATLPSLNLNFSPVTLFPAPASSAGPFNNLTWNGSLSASRSTRDNESRPNERQRTGRFRNSLRVGDFSLSASAEVDNQVTVPVDSAGVSPPDRFRTNVNWQSSLDYQIDLVGSTTLKPTASVEGEAFASDSTGGDLLRAPLRMNFGASLSTDLYGLFPGFGPFSRLRHKLSPSVNWSYSPPVSPNEELEGLPGAPTTEGGRAENVLNVSLNQTFEAKMGGDGDGSADTAAAASDTAAGGPDGGGAGGRDAEKVTLLSLRTSGLSFDFGASDDRPVLTTQEIRSNISSDLLRGLSFNVTHDLFAGTGEERTFDPMLTRVGTSFSFSSGESIGEVLGLGLPGAGGESDSGGEPTGGTSERQEQDDLGARGSVFSRSDREEQRTGAGPWEVSIDYSLFRPRSTEEDEAGREENQTISGNLEFRPTANWEVDWRTSYNVTAGAFGSHQLRLRRRLHRWEAEFSFSKAPNGNVRFDLMVRLTDAPEIKVPYQIQTRQGEGRGTERRRRRP